MKTTAILGLVLTASLAFPAVTSVAENKGKPKKATEKDLTGGWDGANQPRRENDWGEVTLKATEAGYIGTYSDTFNGQLGSFTFKRIADRRYQGLWWESSLQRYGSFTLEVPKDAGSISVNWQALSDGGARSGKSTLKRK